MSDQAILGAAITTTAILTGFTLWVVDTLKAAARRHRRDLEHRAARKAAKKEASQ